MTISASGESIPYVYRHNRDFTEVLIGKPDILLIEACFFFDGLLESDLRDLFRHRPHPRHAGITWDYSFNKTCCGRGLLTNRNGRWHATPKGLDQITRCEIRGIRGRWYGWEDDRFRNYRLEHPGVTKRQYWDAAVDYVQMKSAWDRISVLRPTGGTGYVPVEYLHTLVITAAESCGIMMRQAVHLLQGMTSQHITPDAIVHQAIMDGLLAIEGELLHPTKHGIHCATAARNEATRRSGILRANKITAGITDDFVLKWGCDWWWDDRPTAIAGHGSMMIENRAASRLTRLWKRWISLGVPPDTIDT